MKNSIHNAGDEHIINLTPAVEQCLRYVGIAPDSEGGLRYAYVTSFLDRELGEMGFKAQQIPPTPLREYSKSLEDGKYSYYILVSVNGLPAIDACYYYTMTHVHIEIYTNVPNLCHKNDNFYNFYIFGDGEKECREIVKTIKQKEDKLVRRIAMKKFEDAWDKSIKDTDTTQ